MNSTLVSVLILVCIVLCAELIKTWMKQKQAQPEQDSDLEDALSNIDKLEERIRVLERIITENKFDLRKEIDSL